MSDSPDQPENQENGKKTVNIVVNGRQKTVPKDEISYQEIVELAFDNPPRGANIVITVTYRRGHGNKPEGSLVEGQTVKVKEGMEFDVRATDRS